MRKSDQENVKAFMSRQVDRGRLAWGRIPVEAPRQCIVIGTTNSEGYLRDQTGNRRWWPKRVGRLNRQALERDRDQLWAEAAVREAAAESIVLPRNLWAAAGRAQDERLVEDPWTETLRNKLNDENGNVRDGKVSNDALYRILGLHSAAQRDVQTGTRLSAAMQALGFRRKAGIRIGDNTVRGYARGNGRLRDLSPEEASERMMAAVARLREEC